MGPLGLPELIFLLVLALLIFGPKRLPEIGRTVGRGLAELRRASEDLKRTLNTELAIEDDSRPAARRPPGLRAKPATAIQARSVAPAPLPAGEPVAATPAAAEEQPVADPAAAREAGAEVTTPSEASATTAAPTAPGEAP